MEWIIFLLITGIWLFSLFLAREKETYFRRTLFSFITFILGTSILFSGISFPDGSTTVTTGTTSVQTIDYVTYTAETTGTNSSPHLWGLGWALTLIGIFGLLFWFTGTFEEIKRLIQESQRGSKNL